MALNRYEPVLVVDDNLEMRTTLRMCLEECGFATVVEADNGLAARSQLNTNEFSLIVCDWMMPGLNGLELLKLVRESARHRRCPFIMVTGAADKDKVTEALKYGVTGFLVKPFPIGAFQKAIEKASKAAQRSANSLL